VVGAVASVAAVTDDGDNTVTGRDADRATAAALRLTHGGTANSVERDSENGATWEVEVTRTDGTTVDVRLDENFRKVVIEGDSENG
jgi:ABC-type xylose transport system substrate-binding protein